MKIIIGIILVLLMMGCAGKVVEDVVGPAIEPDTTETMPPDIDQSDSKAEQITAADEPETAIDVQMLRSGFDPNEVEIGLNGKIVFKNMDERSHSVVNHDIGMRSGPINAGESFEFVFEENGTFEIFDSTFAKRMTVVVS